MKKKDNEVKMYGVTVGTDEAFTAIMSDDLRKNAFTKIGAKFVYQDPHGQYQMFLFLTKEERNKAYELLHRYFKTAAIAVQPAYVEKKYLNEVHL